MEVDPEDNVHKLFMDLTKDGIRNIVTVLRMDIRGLKELSVIDAEGVNL